MDKIILGGMLIFLVILMFLASRSDNKIDRKYYDYYEDKEVR